MVNNMYWDLLRSVFSNKFGKRIVGKLDSKKKEIKVCIEVSRFYRGIVIWFYRRVFEVVLVFF